MIMLIESPDKLIINGKKLSWIDGTTFFAFKTPQGKTHIAITAGSGTEFILQINQIDLTDYIKKNLPAMAVYLDHESLANVLHQLKPEMIKDKMNREEFLFSGRLWNGNGRNYISFWNNKKLVDKSLLDKFMGYVKVTYENTVFEFPNNQGDYKPYDKIDEPKIPSQKNAEDKFMSQIHTLPPGAKKWAMRGMSMREALFRESPDDIYPDDEHLTFEGPGVKSVFSIFKDLKTGQQVLLTALTDGNGRVRKVTTGDSLLDLDMKLKDVETVNAGVEMIHGNLLYKLVDRITKNKDIDEYDLRMVVDISGRTFFSKKIHYISVWNRLSDFVKYKNEIDKLMNLLKASKDTVRFETIDFPGEYNPYNEVFAGYSEKKESKLSAARIKDLMKKQHLDPRAKRILRTLASNDKHIDSLNRAAIDMNISVAQLRNMMVTGD